VKKTSKVDLKTFHEHSCLVAESSAHKNQGYRSLVSTGSKSLRFWMSMLWLP